MTIEVKVLLVEDDKTQINNWKMAAESHNVSSEVFHLHLDIKEDKDSAMNFINNNDIDAAIVDIRLGSDNNRDGGIVLNNILESELAVVIILSGEPGVEDLLPSWNPKIKKITKGDNGIQQTLEWLENQIPMLKQIKEVQREIKREMVKLFTHSIWPRWDAWRNLPLIGEAGNSFVKDALTRHLTAHIYASFMDKTEEKVHPEEWYFIPPLKKQIKTGDILRNEAGAIEVVITPRCDLARDGKNETYQLVECKDVSEEWQSLCEKFSQKKSAYERERSTASEKGMTNAMEDIRRYAQHKSNSNIYHFLPEIKTDNRTIGPFLVQFDKLRSVRRDSEGIKEELLGKRIATIAPEFLPSLIERLGAFFSRFGTPDYSHPD